MKWLRDNNYRIVIVTNQKGISSGKTNIYDFKEKVDEIDKQLDVPIELYASKDNDHYRKPNITFWNIFLYI